MTPLVRCPPSLILILLMYFGFPHLRNVTNNYFSLFSLFSLHFMTFIILSPLITIILAYIARRNWFLSLIIIITSLLCIGCKITKTAKIPGNSLLGPAITINITVAVVTSYGFDFSFFLTVSRAFLILHQSLNSITVFNSDVPWFLRSRVIRLQPSLS